MTGTQLPTQTCSGSQRSRGSAVADSYAADFAHDKEESHPGNTTCDRHRPDRAELEALHANLDGGSSSACAHAHAYRHAHNHPGAGAFRSRSLWPLRPHRFRCRAHRLYSLGGANLVRVLRTAHAVCRTIHDALWPRPLTPSLNALALSRRSRSWGDGSLAHALSERFAGSQ